MIQRGHFRPTPSRTGHLASTNTTREAHNRIPQNRARPAAAGGAAATLAAGVHNRLTRNEAFRHGNGFENAVFGGHRWERGRYRRFWAGGVFWPFFFGDYFSYVLWPGDYDELFWDWGPDAFLWGAFWPYYGYPYGDYDFYDAGYGEGGPDAGDIYAPYRNGAGEPQRLSAISPQEAATACRGFAPGVEEFPVQKIADIIHPTPEQRSALEEFKEAVGEAESIMSHACPAETPETPMARLDAMERRLEAIQRAETVIRGPLEKVYGLFSAQQKQELDASIGGGPRSQQAHPDLARLCPAEAAFTHVPADDIARTIKLDGQQTRDLDSLKQASAKAARFLRESCPRISPEGLVARLDAAQKRIAALIEAINVVRPHVQNFFASLSGPQKTALNERAPVTLRAANR